MALRIYPPLLPMTADDLAADVPQQAIPVEDWMRPQYDYTVTWDDQTQSWAVVPF